MNNQGGYRKGSGRKAKGYEFGFSGKTKKFSINLPIEVEEWIIQKEGKNRNDKLVRFLVETMKKG